VVELLSVLTSDCSAPVETATPLIWVSKELVEVPIAVRLLIRLDIPLSGMPVKSAPFPPKALAGLVAVMVLVKMLIPVNVLS